MNRFHTLDYLRGLAAFGIMIFHYFTWNFGEYSSDSVLGRFGFYGVSIFYVLSGLTLYLVYFNKMEVSGSSIKDFFIKRFFRIMPLFWLAILWTIVVKMDPPGMYRLIINITGLFSIVDCSASIALGGWSIGNEIVFYLFFPIFVILSKKAKLLFYLLSIGLFLVFMWYAFVFINANSTAETQWPKYVDPFNQVFLFLAGYLLGYFFTEVRVSRVVSWGLIIVSILVFAFLPVEGDRINLITGYNRLIFSFLCIAVCFGVFKLQGNAGILFKPLSWLGEASYSVYLLHPIVYAVIVKIIHFSILPKWYTIVFSIPCTLIASYYVYQIFEKYFIKKGKELTLKPAMETSINGQNPDHLR